METTQTLYVRMREDELVARARYHEDRLREAKRVAAFHQAAAEGAHAELNMLRHTGAPHSRLTAA